MALKPCKECGSPVRDKAEKCPNCGTKVKGFFASSQLIPQSKTDFINKYNGNESVAYCEKCFLPLMDAISSQLKKEKEPLTNRLKNIVSLLPILTSPAPIFWEYEILGIVNTQQTAGTGFYTELSRSWNDFFGSGSNATNSKILGATNLCKSDLRIMCAKMGGNAIISTDIDYNEIGSGSTNMLMVCMAGTAVKIKNLENSGISNHSLLDEITELSNQIEVIISQEKGVKYL